jgi:endonuclease-3
VKPDDIHEIMAILDEEVKQWRTPAVTVVAQGVRNPFKVLVSCILSLRTQDRTTAEASARLFALADTPDSLSKLPVEVIEKAIFPVGFYRNKAVQLRNIAGEICQYYAGKVPDEIDELLKFKGVGRKTANLVVTLGYGKLGICVDTHVHRICNRWGYVQTSTAEATEYALRGLLPEKYWIIINDHLVAFGQNHCTPISPHCSSCRLTRYCEKVNVEKFR